MEKIKIDPKLVQEFLSNNGFYWDLTIKKNDYFKGMSNKEVISEDFDKGDMMVNMTSKEFIGPFLINVTLYSFLVKSHIADYEYKDVVLKDLGDEWIKYLIINSKDEIYRDMIINQCNNQIAKIEEETRERIARLNKEIRNLPKIRKVEIERINKIKNLALENKERGI